MEDRGSQGGSVWASLRKGHLIGDLEEEEAMWNLQGTGPGQRDQPLQSPEEECAWRVRGAARKPS